MEPKRTFVAGRLGAGHQAGEAALPLQPAVEVRLVHRAVEVVGAVTQGIRQVLVPAKAGLKGIMVRGDLSLPIRGRTSQAPSTTKRERHQV